MPVVVRSAIIDAPIERVWAVLRDFNSHIDWHPVVAESRIEQDLAPDAVGCVRRFRLRSGEELREQLLSLSEREHSLSYCILDSPIPLIDYVAAIRLARVTDGERTFWHWRSSFRAPPGRGAELARMVGTGVYESGFAGLREFLARGGAPSAPALRPRVAVDAAPLAGHGVMIARHGGPEVLAYAPVAAPPPGAGDARLRQTVIGVNYIDVYMRTGAYKLIEPPGIVGMEAAGTVVDVGPGVSHVMPGDRVAYACAPPGAYASVRTMKADQLVVLPPEIDDETAAAAMLKGMTAEYLLRRVRRVRRGDVVLVHAAAGATGQLLCQWASHLGATVIGTVGGEEKARVARDAGCAHPLVGVDESLGARVRELSAGRGADVIYDGIGRDSFAASLDALALCGHLVSYGQASGAVAPIDPAALSAKSATLTRPVLFHYTREPATLRAMAGNVFAMIRRGALRVQVAQRYPLAAAADAHRALEARRTTGASILLA